MITSGQFHRGFNARQVNVKGCTFAHFTVEPDIALTLLNNAVDGREPESCAFSQLLRGKERLGDIVSGGG